MPVIYHIATAEDWSRAVREGAYATSTIGRTLAEEGFLHASTASQVNWVANMFYRDVPGDLVLLVIDPALLASPLRFDDVPGQDEPFPHIYGPLNTSAVIDAVPLSAGPDGTYTIQPPAASALPARTPGARLVTSRPVRLSSAGAVGTRPDRPPATGPATGNAVTAPGGRRAVPGGGR